MTKGLSSSYTIQIKSTEEINALNKNEIISADSSEMDIAHTKTATIPRIPDNKKKTTPIVPSDFEHWVKSHGGDKDFVNLINTKVAPRKRRSLLSNVSFAYSSDESSNSEDEEDEEDFYQLAVNTAVKGKALSTPPKKPLISVNKSTVSQPTTPIKKSNWLSGLFHKQPKSSPSSTPPKPPIYKTIDPSPVPLTNKTVNISNFFSSKKKQTAKPKEQKMIPGALPKRYPIPIERVIYEISWMKLHNPRRPLLHHVSISNMLVWYTNMVDRRQTLLYSQIPARSASSHVVAFKR